MTSSLNNLIDMIAGFVFSDDEPTALVQLEGGPCAVIAPIQAFLLKNVLFSHKRKEEWNDLSGIYDT